jgi:short-subunit dehydrogenase
LISTNILNPKKLISLFVAQKLMQKILTQFSRSLENKVVLITGGSKGLGLVLAEHLIEEGCKIAICARDENELKKAKLHLEKKGTKVKTCVCDVTDKKEVEKVIHNVIESFGCIDILINNAGIIQVGPMETFKHKQYEKAMDIMYWGISNTTFSVLPHMKSRKQGHIVNITSIGGKVSVPHLLPYCAAKFAAAGFSEGSAAELLKDNIYVTTIVPGLMRTGSYVNAFFQQGNKKEFKLFSLMSTSPLLTISADNAARKIIMAVKEKKSFKVLGFQARILLELDHFFPNTMTKVFSFASKMIPAAHHQTSLEQGKEIKAKKQNTEVPGFREIGKKIRREHQTLA